MVRFLKRKFLVPGFAKRNRLLFLGLMISPNQHFAEENKLLQMDFEGKRITGNLADKYILLKKQRFI